MFIHKTFRVAEELKCAELALREGIARITPFSIFGHWNRPSSSRFANRRTPVPSRPASPVGALGPEHVDRAVERIGADHVANQRGQTLRAFAEVDRPRRDQHARRARRTDHFAAFNAPMIAVTIATSASGQIQTLDPATSSSMTGGRAFGLLSALSAGSDAEPGVATTTEANGRASVPSSAFSTRLATPVEQLLRRQPMAARDVADQRAVLKALRNDRRLLLPCPGSPPSRARENLEPLRRTPARALRHVTML
jgi:hypothetical protein